MTPSPYPWLLLAGIAVSVVSWSRLAQRDSRLMLLYGAALVSAFFGAKVVYLLAEGWLFWDAPDRWLIWATEKSVLAGKARGSVRAAGRVGGSVAGFIDKESPAVIRFRHWLFGSAERAQNYF